LFAPFNPGGTGRRFACLGGSLAGHLLLLGWFLQGPAPIFIAPASVMQGEGGHSVARLYFGGATGVTQEGPAPSLVLPKPPKKRGLHAMQPPPHKKNLGKEITEQARTDEKLGGSPFGSLSYGPLFGPEIRPALPQTSPDPVVGADLLNGMVGDEIVEITIDVDGTIIAMKILQSMGPAVDQRVLAALEQWHFSPASRNGVPIPSKQDVHYHFPR